MLVRPASARARLRRRAVRLSEVGILVMAAVTGATASSDATVPPVLPSTPGPVAAPPAATSPATAPATSPAASLSAASVSAAAVSAAADSGRRAGAAVTAVPAAFDLLPTGPAPSTVPYAIGTRVYFAGHGSDLGDRFTAAFPDSVAHPAQRQFTTVIGAGGVAWAQFTGAGADVVHVVGQVTASGGYLPFHTSTGRPSALAVTTSGLVAMPENGQVYAGGGALVAAFTGSPNIDCGSCAVTAAGPRLVLDQGTGPVGRPEHQATWLWYPPAAIQRLDDRFRAVGRLGSGWLGLHQDDGCWRLAPATAPERLGSPICSLATPLVAADGRRAVVVQGGRLRVVDPTTGTTLSNAAMPAIEGWTPGLRYAVPAAWESDDAYLVTARVDDALALVRCSARSGECRRAVRVTVRPGVDRIVAERGPEDAVPAG